MRKRKKDDYALAKSILGGIGLGMAVYVVILLCSYLWENLS